MLLFLPTVLQTFPIAASYAWNVNAKSPNVFLSGGIDIVEKQRRLKLLHAEHAPAALELILRLKVR
jgi:hypothetical protein